MTYITGSLISAIDYTTIIGNKSSNSAYVNDADATNALSALWGIGYGTRGYGQTTPLLNIKTTGDIASGQNWADLVTVINSCATHTGTVLVDVPTESVFATGNPISALTFDWLTAISTLDTNRSNVDVATMSTSASPLITSERTINWADTILFEGKVDFGDENSARYFFNSGSQIKLSLDPSLSTAQWQAFLELVGQISIGADTTSSSLPGGTAVNAGYYNLSTNTYTTLFTQYDTGPYSNNYVKVSAKRLDTNSSVNGGNGSSLAIKYEFVDAYSATISGTLTLDMNSYKPSSGLTIANPVVTKITGLDGGGGIPIFVYNKTLSGNVFNYNLLTDAIAAGYPNNKPIYATITVDSTAVVGSTSTSAYAITIPSLFANSTVILINNGVIAGAGGSGGVGAPSGVCGCVPGGNGTNGGPAILLQYTTSLFNYGTIGGGGGGGGGGGAECGYIWNASAGGGGGGAGSNSGVGGSSNLCGVTAGRNGQPGSTATLLAGGNAGLPGNFYTAAGGNGGNLGMQGSNGQSINAEGGIGGFGGLAIVGTPNLSSSSILGNIMGNTDFTLTTSGFPNAQGDFYYSQSSLTSSIILTATDVGLVPASWASIPTTSDNITATLTPVVGQPLKQNVTFTSNSPYTITYRGTFTLRVTATTGTIASISVTVAHSYIDTTPPPPPDPGSCFLAGSLVAMANGNFTPIEQIRPGDLVVGAFGETNEVLALDWVVLGDRWMYKINDEHSTSDDHPHVSADRKFYSAEPNAIYKEWGKIYPVILGDDSIIMKRNIGLTKTPVKQLTTGIELQTTGGPKLVENIEPFRMDASTPLYNLVVDGSHTYFVEGYAVTGWPREDDFDYSTWTPIIHPTT